MGLKKKIATNARILLELHSCISGNFIKLAPLRLCENIPYLESSVKYS